MNAESVLKTLKILNLTTTIAILMKLTTIVYLHKIFNLIRSLRISSLVVSELCPETEDFKFESVC